MTFVFLIQRTVRAFPRRVLARVFALSVLFLIGCSRTPPETDPSTRLDEPARGRAYSYDQDRMDRAMAEARANLHHFIEAVQNQTAQTERFAVKKAFPYAEGQEFLWVRDVRLEGDYFVGVLANRSAHTDLQARQRVRVKREEVIDWSYRESGRLIGGYTDVALMFGTPRAEQFRRASGIEWSDYSFLNYENKFAPPATGEDPAISAE